ncbi:RNA polymerase sigma-70 factor [Cesiribacter sp. SM1]|uniref:RNA polymerase sigma-70 factor n=1 Tax=Cesiribacter sp. SM1 TaxID=2861196 RepID=UPI001CD5D457
MFLKVEQAKDIVSLYDYQSPEEKIEALFRSCYPMLCKSLYRILRNTEEAEDIVQETFLKLWDRRQSLELGPATISYLYRACYNTALNVLRQRKPQEQPEAAAAMLASDDTADKSMQLMEVEERIAQAIESLPPNTRMVFSLSRYEEMSYKTIAEHLDISVKAVEKHMGIALGRLRYQLSDLLCLLLLISSIFFKKFF